MKQCGKLPTTRDSCIRHRRCDASSASSNLAHEQLSITGSIMKRIVKLAAVALMIVGTASVATADRFHHDHGHRNHRRSNTSVGIQIGRVGISFGTPRYNASRLTYGRGGLGINLGSSGFGRGYGYGRSHATWHDTSHYDYHGPSLVPHGNHYDYVPGHYDLHRTGHWDSHRH